MQEDATKKHSSLNVLRGLMGSTSTDVSPINEGDAPTYPITFIQTIIKSIVARSSSIGVRVFALDDDKGAEAYMKVANDPLVKITKEEGAFVQYEESEPKGPRIKSSSYRLMIKYSKVDEITLFENLKGLVSSSLAPVAIIEKLVLDMYPGLASEKNGKLFDSLREYSVAVEAENEKKKQNKKLENANPFMKPQEEETSPTEPKKEEQKKKAQPRKKKGVGAPESSKEGEKTKVRGAVLENYDAEFQEEERDMVLTDTTDKEESDG